MGKRRVEEPNSARDEELPSSPKRLPIAVLYCRLKDKRLIRSFAGLRSARAFLELITESSRYKWLADDRILARNGVEITSVDLEAVVETPSGYVLQEPFTSEIAVFLGKKREVRSRGTGLTIGLADLCKELNLETRVARQRLRKAGKKRGYYGWTWTEDEVDAIKKILREK